MAGLSPNRKSHPLVHDWFAVVFRGGDFAAIEPLEDLIERTGLNARRHANPGQETHTQPL